MASTISSVVAKSKIVEKSPPRSSSSGMDVLTSRTGGAYIPPARLKMMQANIKDKTSLEFQRIAWEALKKSINGHINKVNVANLSIIVRELFKENLVRGRGLFARSILQAQAASPTFTHVYAAVVAVMNSKFPQIGELILKRLILQFRRGYKRNDKQTCLHSARFIAHLVNQEVAHEVVALELLTLLLENTTNDSVEVAVGFLKEVGKKLSDVSPKGIHSIFERLRNILHEGSRLDRRVQYMIEVMFAIRKDGFKDHPAVINELDLVEESDQFTHLITLDEVADPEDILNVFKFDPEYEKTEAKYEAIKKEILDEEDSDEDGSDVSGSDEEEEEESTGPTMIVDNTETNLVELRRTIYLTIQSSLDFEECAHKLLKLELKGKEITELCHMVIDCCAQQRTYFKFFGLLAQRFCSLSEEYVDPFSDIFKSCYDTIHRFETNKLRNVAKLFAHLFFTDSISWILMGHIRLNEDETTSSSRVFIKILFQELAEYVGLTKLNARIKDQTLLLPSGGHAFDGLFPRDNPRNTRFAINFFTSIGLGGLTDDLREHLAAAPKVPVLAPFTSESVAVASTTDSDSSSDSDSSTSSPSSSSSSSSSSSEDERKKRKKYKKSGRGKKARKESSESPGRKKIKKERTSRSESRSPKRREESSKRREESSKRREESSKRKEESLKRREESSKRREESSKRREESSKKRRDEDDGRRLDAGDSRDKKRSRTPERRKRSKDSRSPEHSKRSRRSPRDTDRTERTSSKSPKRSKPSKSSKSPKRSKPSKSSKSPKRSKPSKSPNRREQSPKHSRSREERSKERNRSPEVDRRKDSKRHRRDHS